MLRDQELARIYRLSRGPVALCDESYRLGPGEATGFYTITAVLFTRESMDPARQALVDLAGPRGWHTTEAYEAGHDARIHKVLAAVGEHSEWSIVTVAAPIEGHDRRSQEAARKACLGTLLPEITRGGDPAQVVVMDTRGDERADGADRRTAAELRGRREIPHRTLLRHADDKLEPLLGAADAVGWAARRLLARDEHGWWANVSDVATLLHAPTGTRINTDDLAQKSNSAEATAVPPAPDGVTGLTSTGVDSQNPPLLPASVSHSSTDPGNTSGTGTGHALRRLLDQAFPLPAAAAVRQGRATPSAPGKSQSASEVEPEASPER